MLAIIFFLLPIGGTIAAQEDIDISASGYGLTEFDKKLIKSIIRANNKGLPIKEVMISVEPYEFKRSDGSLDKRVITRVIVIGEATDDFFEGEALDSGIAKSVASAKRALEQALYKRNKYQAEINEYKRVWNKGDNKVVNPTGSGVQGAQGENAKDLKSGQKEDQGQKKSDPVAAPKVKKGFKIVPRK